MNYLIMSFNLIFILKVENGFLLCPKCLDFLANKLLYEFYNNLKPSILS